MNRKRQYVILIATTVLSTLSRARADDAYHYGPVPLDMATRTYDYAAAGPVTLDESGHYRNNLGSFTALGIDYHQPWFQPLTHQAGRYMNGIVSPSGFDLDRVDGDLRLLKNAGFNVIVLRAQWGSLDNVDCATFQDNLRKWNRVFDLIEKHGLYVEVWCAFNSCPPEVLAAGSLGLARNQYLTNQATQARIIDHYLLPLRASLKTALRSSRGGGNLKAPARPCSMRTLTGCGSSGSSPIASTETSNV